MGMSLKCTICNVEAYEFDLSVEESENLGVKLEFDQDGSVLYVCEDCE